MDLKSKYSQLSKEDFKNYLLQLKSNETTLHLLSNQKCPYFYCPSQETNTIILNLNKAQWEFDSLINSFSPFAKNQIIQSFLINEIEASNKIENIQSTRHDIFSIMNKAKIKNDKNLISIVNAYKLLLETKGQKVSSLFAIRKIYDNLLDGTLDKEDFPDGKYFRKKEVFITDSLKIIHTGLLGENNINSGMEEFLKLYNSNLEIYEKMILCHFLFETIHPYYDGNGRLGRFLFSNGLFLESSSCFSFLISSAINNEKSNYYKAFKKARDEHEFGCINSFVETIASILLNKLSTVIEELKSKKELVNNLSSNCALKNSERKIYLLIAEASILSDYGIKNEEIMHETGVSKRTLIYALNHFKELNILNDTQIGRFIYHKIKL